MWGDLATTRVATPMARVSGASRRVRRIIGVATLVVAISPYVAPSPHYGCYSLFSVAKFSCVSMRFHQFCIRTDECGKKGIKTLDKMICFRAYYVCVFVLMLVTSNIHCNNISNLFVALYTQK